MKKILIVLPGHPRKVTGGYKIVFEYANRLVKDGNEVIVGYIDKESLNKYKIPNFIKVKILSKLVKREPKWFNLNKNIKRLTFRDKKAIKKIGKPDIVIATAAITADFVKNNFNGAKKFYLIQDFESWDLSPEKLYRTYNYGFQNIVVSRWLKQLVDKYSAKPSIYIKNPLDISKYRVIVPVSERNPFIIGMLYHSGRHKGVKFALKAIEKVKNKYPNLKLIMFGTANLHNRLPNWITYYKNASQKQTIKIYNSISVFVCATIAEGFGLTGLEAMACGAALASTDYLGVQEYAENNKNALLSPIKDVNALSNNIVRLINNKCLRERLEKNALIMIQSYSWGKAFKKFKQCLKNN